MIKKTLNSKEIIKRIEEKSREIKKYDIKKIGLFGSFAKNKQHKKSDIDIIVNFEKETFDNYLDLLFLLERMFRKKIDLVIEKDLHPELKYIKRNRFYCFSNKMKPHKSCIKKIRVIYKIFKRFTNN